MTSIGWSAFNECTALTRVTLPDSLTFIDGIGILSLQCSLTSIKIPKNVEHIGSSAFRDCSKLKNIIFAGRTAPELKNERVFEECTALTAIYVPCGADGYTAANGWPEDKVQKSEHRMDRHLRVPATCTTDGTIEHWRCALCGGYFLDEAGTKEISEEQIVEKATGHDWGEPVWN